ncbi:MAG TPA: biotin/lipoyl-containing protein, partial [Streptosporangiaceae bacterium]|nr:biotin/lipoyl-containing protein [Streptosporangiaceae bacterium]
MPEFCLPDLGEGLTEAEITAWRVQVGDEVSTDQVVVEVETAKAAVEVPVPFAGRVEALHAREGQVVPVGAPLISVTPAAAAAPEPSGSVLVGYGTPAGSARRRRHVRPGR